MPKAKDVMVEDVITFSPDDKISEVAETFLENEISGAPVVYADGHVVGMITEFDLIQIGGEHPKITSKIKGHLPISLAISSKEEDRDELKMALREIRNKKVKEAMTSDVVELSPDTELGEIAKEMDKNDINRIPITDEDGILLGLVARADIIEAFWGEMSE